MREHNFSIDYDGRSITCYLPDPEDYIQNKSIQTKNFYEMDLLKKVSHDMETLKDICNAGIVVNQGQMYYYNDINDAMAEYENINKKAG